MRNIDDQAYISKQPSDMYKTRYLVWKQKMLTELDDILRDFDINGVRATMEARYMTPRDIALLVRLNYLTPEEINKYGLSTIEESVPT